MITSTNASAFGPIFAAERRSLSESDSKLPK
jgi:hypothetical protein